MGCQAQTDIKQDEAVSSAKSFNLETSKTIHPEAWPEIETPALDPAVEARIDEIMSKMTVEQKVGQTIQADTEAVTPEQVKEYRLGSILSGGNSAPGDLPYADAAAWLTTLDAYFEASIDPEGVELAIPLVSGIDAVHGHTNLTGAVIFPHNIGLGAANNPELVKDIAEVTARELRISGHDWTFAPTLAVPQNDRWGRAYEGFSEDPKIVESYGGMIVEGLQGRVGTDEFMAEDRVISSAKHFLADGGTENGVDQGNSIISEKELLDLHLAGYLTAVKSGAQSVMASFSSWQGQPMHGHKLLLTDVLKGRMNFQGFVVGDWNGHALIEGCTATDCPQALNAGIDMFMAPDSWKGLYESTLAHVKAGTIPMSRLDDAVRRILRAKINAGLFEAVKPSQRALAGDTSLLGSEAHRAIAQQAVRESLVLLKNNNNILPLSADMNIHVVGKGADSIAKFSGGWTLSWQGGNHTNDEFPNSKTFLATLTDLVGAAGGKVSYDASGENIPDDADIIIAVYGEDPYAEFRGDVDHVDFTPNDFDTTRLAAYKNNGQKVVSVFLSGRPLWTNPEMNASDAFIAAWLPGSETTGITDLLFRSKADYDFTGRLPFSWPKLATQHVLSPYHANYDPLFPLGYGLSYGDDGNLAALAEESGLVASSAGPKGVFYTQGTTPEPWRLSVNGSNVSFPYNTDGVALQAYNHKAQEDSMRVSLASNDDLVAIFSRYTHDFARETGGAMELTFKAKWISGDKTANVSIGCDTAECDAFQPVTLNSEWTDYAISLKCFQSKGVDMAAIQSAFSVKSNTGNMELVVSDVKLDEESPQSIRCN